MSQDLIEVKNLKKYFPIKKGILSRVVGSVKAVDGVSFCIRKGETLGLVGESGCGKSTTGRLLLRLLEPTEGSTVFDGKVIYELNKNELRKLRSQMQIIFQDPFSSLNPRMTVGSMLKEAMKIHNIGDGNGSGDRIGELLVKVGLSPDHVVRYPHEFSGGQRQRIGIARALAVNPKFIIADEPVSALDVSIQSQIINLMQELQDELGLTYLFIAHDLSVVEHISTRVGVMYLGKVVELTSSKELYSNPLHPYTKALLSAVPVPDPDYRRDRIILKGDVPSPADPPAGCHFHPRCFMAQKICSKETPVLKEVAEDHFVACLLQCGSVGTKI